MTDLEKTKAFFNELGLEYKLYDNEYDKYKKNGFVRLVPNGNKVEFQYAGAEFHFGEDEKFIKFLAEEADW